VKFLVSRIAAWRGRYVRAGKRNGPALPCTPLPKTGAGRVGTAASRTAIEPAAYRRPHSLSLSAVSGGKSGSSAILLSKAARAALGNTRVRSLILAQAAAPWSTVELSCRGTDRWYPAGCERRLARMRQLVFHPLPVPPSAARVRKSQILRHVSLKVTHSWQALSLPAVCIGGSIHVKFRSLPRFLHQACG